MFISFKTRRFADCETVSVDENLMGKEAAVITNCDANYDVSAWKRSSAECLRKMLPNPACYVFGRRASLSILDQGLTRNDVHASSPTGSGSGLSFLRATAGTAIACLSHRNSVRLSVRLSHGWIRQKQCKLGSSNLTIGCPKDSSFMICNAFPKIP